MGIKSAKCRMLRGERQARELLYLKRFKRCINQMQYMNLNRILIQEANCKKTSRDSGEV